VKIARYLILGHAQQDALLKTLLALDLCLRILRSCIRAQQPLSASSRYYPLRVTSLSAMVLYIFEVRGTPYVKMGFTTGCPWGRVRDGFWKQVHPEGCCGKLGWDDLQLVSLCPGTLEDEASIKESVPPTCGEFWPLQELDMLRLAMKVLAIAEHNCGSDNWELPLPPRPAAPPPGRGIEKLECCGGSLLRCYGCGQQFKLWIRLQTHKRESCPATAEPRPACRLCGTRVIKRHLKRHQTSAGCKDVAAGR